MAYLVKISERAQRDLAHIYRFINAEESQAARDWYQGLRSAILSLEELPNRWPVTHENPGLRHILYGRKPHIYRVIYRVLERRKHVEILHIRHGARDRF
jgi:plasmid stabilization system protein ParE